METMSTPDQGWRIVRFGDVVRNVKADVDPKTGDLERYVAGEHMDTDDLHIRRWGMIGDGYLGPAFHRRFAAGQVLYGSRRTYLRKVAVADFDGVCANTTFVLEAVPDLLLQELLPFIMQTEVLTEHSVKNSKGSVNPYVNWGDIASYEFALPPLDEQRRVAEILWAAEDVVESHLVVRMALIDTRRAQTEDFLKHGMPGWHWPHKDAPTGCLPQSWVCAPCSDLLVGGPTNGFSPQVNTGGVGYPTLSISAIRDGQVVVEENLKYAEIGAEEAQKYRLNPGDLLVVRGNGNRGLVGKCGMVTEVPEGCFYPDLLVRIKFDPARLRPQFACIQWNTPMIHDKLVAMAQSTSGIWKINGKAIRQHSLIVPPIPEQDAFLSLMSAVVASIRQVDKHIEEIQELRRGLISALLCPDERC
jgi:type I restriction enzyme S subunit